ncbi:MAG: type II toxin-antitoxin system RelE/ParE family toxin [Deltaproteobacteria bacterium]|nr:type II toxin-antitoxin system RelE/ParE family toxin [Deltaproteobacteria bacterium]MBT6498467.1 type II toxin-antitoxin system RelE/ParE family toxin [Deltaproteobacteria bacterium]
MAKKYKVNISLNAQNDLEHIFFYIAEDNISNARKFILELEKKIYSLDTFPERFALIPENLFFGTSYRHIIHKKYRAIYKIDNNSVYILRVIHGAKLLGL